MYCKSIVAPVEKFIPTELAELVHYPSVKLGTNP